MSAVSVAVGWALALAFFTLGAFMALALADPVKRIAGAALLAVSGPIALAGMGLAQDPLAQALAAAGAALGFAHVLAAAALIVRLREARGGATLEDSDLADDREDDASLRRLP